MITPLDYLREYPVNQVSTPSMSSWGYKGYSEVWLEGSNDWIYRHLHSCADRMVEIARQYSNGANQLQIRALNQAARELMLAQSSDWAFIIKTGTMVEYAVKRTRDHLIRFLRLYYQLKNNRINHDFLCDIESKDNLFPDINFRIYQ